MNAFVIKMGGWLKIDKKRIQMNLVKIYDFIMFISEMKKDRKIVFH